MPIADPNPQPDPWALTPSQLVEALPIIIGAGQVPFIEGPPGGGKSDVVAQVAADMFGNGGPCSDAFFRDIKPAGRDPVDFSGLPVPDMVKRVTEWLRPGFLPVDGEGILFLDEFTAAPPAVQAVLLEFVRQRKAGEYRLPEGWKIVTAGNGAKDRAYTTTMGTAMINRLVRLRAVVDVDDWCSWALSTGLPTLVVAFIRFRPELLHQFNPDKDVEPFPSPRSWAAVGDIMRQNPPDGLRPSLLVGTVGEAANEFEGFLRVYKSLPSIDQILLDPDQAAVPPASETAARYAVAAALTDRASPRNFDAIMTYAGRLPAEFGGMISLGAVRRDPTLRNTRPFIQWATDNGDLMS